MQKKKQEKIKKAITLLVIIICFSFVILVMLKYNIEGEQVMPFNLSEVIVISNAEGKTKTEENKSNENGENNEENPEDYKWNLEIIQYNDIYLQITKNEKYKKNTYIDNISIENINITEPKLGDIKVYMPSNEDKTLFSYNEDYLAKRSITFNGNDSNNMKSLQISNQGGNIAFRIANTNLGEYAPDNSEEVSHNGTILNKLNVNLEDLKMDVSFDIVIKTNISTYRGNVKLELPCGNILSEGTCQKDKKDCTDIIFKRENY